MQKLYVITMYRFADRERHSYVAGVFTKKHAAKQAAQVEKEYRGGNKYYPEILEFEPNNMESKHVALVSGGELRLGKAIELLSCVENMLDMSRREVDIFLQEIDDFILNKK